MEKNIVSSGMVSRKMLSSFSQALAQAKAMTG